jgi:hypothetical protein
VTVDGETEVADAGELLLPQQVPSSAVVQVPPLNLAALQPASPPTIRLATVTGSSHSSDRSAHEGADQGAASVSTPNASTKVQGHIGAGETSIFATPGEVQPNRMDRLATDSEDLRSDLRMGIAQIGAQMAARDAQIGALLQALTESTSKLTTVDQTVQTVQEQALTVKGRVCSHSVGLGCSWIFTAIVFNDPCGSTLFVSIYISLALSLRRSA